MDRRRMGDPAMARCNLGARRLGQRPGRLALAWRALAVSIIALASDLKARRGLGEGEISSIRQIASLFKTESDITIATMKQKPVVGTWAGLLIAIPVLAGERLETLPQTKPLDWEESDLSSRLMDGAHRFIEREIAESVAKRSRFWTRDFTSPAAYASSFHDITVGDNSFAGITGYPAGAGWDAATGLGTPDVANLITALQKTTP